MNNAFGFEDTKKWSKLALEQKLVPMIWGSGGIGKSALAIEIANDYNLEPVLVELGNYEPTEVSGYPSVNADNRSEYFPFIDFPLESDPIPDGKSGWLIILDEFTNADAATQKAAYSIVHGHRVGNKKLHERARVICMGNGASHGADTTELTDPMKARLVHIHMASRAKDWINNFGNKHCDWRITSWIAAQPEMLDNYKELSPESDTFSCPRTVTMLSNLISHGTLANVTPDIPNHLSIFAGIVGGVAAKSFIDHCQLGINLPSLSSIVADPVDTAIPVAHGEQFMLTSRLSHEIDTSNAAAIMTYMDRLPNPEYVVTCLRGIAARNPAVLSTPAVTQWMANTGRSLI